MQKRAAAAAACPSLICSKRENADRADDRQNNDQQSNQQNDLNGVSFLITAGPTREAIDPVRYLSNHSSGKMGYAIAEAAAKRGAQVTLVSGPVSLDTPKNVERIDVVSAKEMHQAVQQQATNHQIFIACAAVADFAPAQVTDQKIKKKSSDDELVIHLVQNPDILASVANMTEDRPFTVGFAAETHDVEHYARSKLKRKNIDLICANDVSNHEVGFNSDNNALHLYWHDGDKALPLSSKTQLSEQLIDEIVQQYTQQQTQQRNS